MNKKSIENKWVMKIKPIIAFGILFSIFVSVGSATIEMPNVEQGDGLWGTIDVDAPGLVNINAWSNNSADDMSLSLYNQTGDVVASNFSGNGQISLDYIAPSAGKYSFKVVLNIVSRGGAHKISASSNKPISLTPKNIVNLSNIEQGDGIWGKINVDAAGLVSFNTWSNNSADDMSLSLYNQTGNMVASYFAGNGQISLDYIAPSAGTYSFKVVLNIATGGGGHKISASGNKNLFSIQKNIRRAFNVVQGQAVYYDLSLNAGELIFLNDWSNNSADDMSLSLYNQTGNMVASNFSGNGQISLNYIVPTSGTYSIKTILTVASGGGYHTISLSTNANFTGINVVSPNGGENWTRGTTKTISWTSFGDTGAKVSIELLKNGIPRNINSITENDGSYNWAIPASQIPGTDYKIRIKSTTNPAYNDTSDNNFTINASISPLTVISPNGGENWLRNTTHTINWTYTGSPGPNVKIELYKGTSLNLQINKSYPIGTGGAGSYEWLIPATQFPGNDYTIRITSTSKSTDTDSSDKKFNISAICEPSTISGYKFNDANGNKLKDTGEAGLVSWRINLKGFDTCMHTLVSKYINTNASGYYVFENMNSGFYVVSEDFKLDWIPTTDAAFTFEIPVSSSNVRRDFGNKKFP